MSIENFLGSLFTQSGGAYRSKKSKSHKKRSSKKARSMKKRSSKKARSMKKRSSKKARSMKKRSSKKARSIKKSRASSSYKKPTYAERKKASVQKRAERLDIRMKGYRKKHMTEKAIQKQEDKHDAKLKIYHKSIEREEKRLGIKLPKY